jgi:hypothetical protein
MATPKECQTPDAQYHIHITDQKLEVTVDFGKIIHLTYEGASNLEEKVHFALETILSEYYA